MNEHGVENKMGVIHSHMIQGMCEVVVRAIIAATVLREVEAPVAEEPL